jgi:hypothetical protein
MALSLPSETLANLPDCAQSEISQVRLMRVEESLTDDSEEEFALDGAPTAARELLDPPLDLCEFIAERWSLNTDAAQTLLCDWVRDYQPQRDYSAMLAAAS